MRPSLRSFRIATLAALLASAAAAQQPRADLLLLNGRVLTVDATDRGLSRYPEFLAFLRTLGPTTTFIKSASYLLHGREFRQLRDALLAVSGYLVQDDSGLPYAMLAARGWTLRMHGRYDVPIPPFERAFQPALYEAFREQAPDPLPFIFGYQYHDYRDQRSNVMVGRGPAAQSGAIAPDRPLMLKTAH